VWNGAFPPACEADPTDVGAKYAKARGGQAGPAGPTDPSPTDVSPESEQATVWPGHRLGLAGPLWREQIPADPTDVGAKYAKIDVGAKYAKARGGQAGPAGPTDPSPTDVCPESEQATAWPGHRLGLAGPLWRHTIPCKFSHFVLAQIVN
jgi:hypothetical protein